MDGVELARHRVGEDEHAALAHQRAPLVEVEEVAEPEAHDEHRVQRRVHVVRADVGQPGRDDVRLADDADRLLLGHPLQRHLVDRLGRARGDARHAVGRELALEELAARLHGHPVGRALDRGERRLVAAAPQRGRLAQEGHRSAVHAVVGRRLDVEHGDDALDDVALGVGPVVQLGVRRVHERARVRHRVRVVVCADRAVRAEADRRGLRAALQRRAHEVHVDEQVGLGGAPVQRDGRAVRALADDDVAVRVVGVVVVQAVGPERGEGALADGVAQLGGGHPAMQRQGGDELDVLDTGAIRALDDLLDDLPADVGRAHRRQRDGQVVERDGQPHPRPEERVERIEPERRVQRRGDRAGHVGQRGHRRRRAHDARADRKALEPQLLTRVEEGRRRVLGDLGDAGVALERGAPGGALDGRRRAADGALDEGHQAAFRRSKTVLTRPLRAARGACSSAALKSRRWKARSTSRPGRRRSASFSARVNSSP